MSHIRAICLTITAVGVVTMVLVGRPFSSIIPTVDAQGQTQLVPLVTDQTPLALSNSFGVPQSAVVNQAGDYAFVGNGSSAVFYRRAGAAAPVRVMQMGDEVPGFPGSRNDITNTVRLNNSGLIAFRPDFFQANGVPQGAIFTFDGTSLRQIISGADLAPGGGGAKFERSINIIGLNDSGDISFTAPLVPSNSVGIPFQTTLYIVPAGGVPVRVAGPGDTAPGTGGTFSTLGGLSFNNRGEVLFSANIVGGSSTSGLFIGNITGVRKVVATGDANPFGGTFPAVTTGLLNNAGEVAFAASGGLWTNTPANVTTRKVNLGDPAPAPVGGTFFTPLLQAFDNAGDIAFLAAISGSAVSNQGLFRFRPAGPLEVVAYRNQAAAGAPGESFNTFAAVSINNTGVVSFQSSLLGGSVPSGIFQQTASNSPVNIALDGQPTSLAGGGTYGVSVLSANTQTLNNGSVYFRSDIPGGIADYAEFLNSVGTSTVLMSTADTVPTGARVSLRSFRVGAAGDFVGFPAQRTGGRFSFALHNITNQATTILATDGDAAPGTGGGRIRITNRNTVFVNASGKVVFNPAIIGGSTPRGLFLVGPGSGLTKVVADGDVAPGTGGKTFSNVGLTTVTTSPINYAGQVLFSTTLSPGASRGVFVWSPGSGLSKVAAVGDVISGGTITGLTFEPSINSAGQVAFGATTAGGTGIYVGTPGGTSAKLVAVGDPGPAGSTFLALQTPAFNDSGEVAFMAALTGGFDGGVFVGSTFGQLEAVALSGAAAPAGGNFSITAARPDVAINNQHDMVFRANLTGGTADSGYFIRRGPGGVLQAPVLQGQPAPGTLGVFDTISGTINNFVSENFQLSPDGDLAFQSGSLTNGQRVFGAWHVKTDNTIEELLVRGTVAPEFGGGAAITSTSSTAWNSGGRFAMWARVSGGTFTDGIFLFVPTVSTNTPAGTAVPVAVTDSTTGTVPVSLTFANVSADGETTLTTASGGPALPTAFALGDPPVFYNIATTATFSGSINVCIDFSAVSFPPGANLRLLHFQGGVWVDVTTSGPSGDLICGSVTSLSPFTVVRVLNSPPVARARSITVSADASCHATVTASQVDDGSSDPDSGDTVSVSLDSSGPFSLGPHQVRLTVTDSHNATSSATATVTVVDNTLPVISCSASITVDAISAAGAVVDYPTPTATDNCGGPVTVSCTPTSGGTFPIGTTAITCKATDASSNMASCMFNVTARAPLAVKQDVRAAIATLRAAASDKKDRDKLDDALRHLDKARAPAWWIDPSHLTEKDGEKVFNEEKDVVKDLSELIQNTKSMNPTDAALMDLIGRLVQADRVLALISISESTDQKRIAKALDEIAKGDAERDNSKPHHADSAIDHYKNAWKKT